MKDKTTALSLLSLVLVLSPVWLFLVLLPVSLSEELTEDWVDIVFLVTGAPIALLGLMVGLAMCIAFLIGA